jgi:serine/threonine protein kinase
MVELCDVLDYLHQQSPPIIFRDLKPGNVMITPADRVKLIDFGIARFFVPGKRKDTMAYGTHGYSAPEQYGDGQTDARSDIYSLGVMLHELLTGHNPTTTPFQLPPARRFGSRLPEGVVRMIEKATQTNPTMRYQSAVALRDALASVNPASESEKLIQGRPGGSSSFITQPGLPGTISARSAPVRKKRSQTDEYIGCFISSVIIVLVLMVLCVCCAITIWALANTDQFAGQIISISEQPVWPDCLIVSSLTG